MENNLPQGYNLRDEKKVAPKPNRQKDTLMMIERARASKIYCRGNEVKLKKLRKSFLLFNFVPSLPSLSSSFYMNTICFQ